MAWLCRRAALLAGHGYVHRGLVYQLVAYHMAPSDRLVQRSLARLFVQAGDGARALEMINLLEQDDSASDDPGLSLIRASAHLALGETEETARILAHHLDVSGDAA